MAASGEKFCILQICSGLCPASFLCLQTFTRIFYARTQLSSYSCAKAHATTDVNRTIRAPCLWFSIKPSYGVTFSFCCKQVQLFPFWKVCPILAGDQNCPCHWQTSVFAAELAWITWCVTINSAGWKITFTEMPWMSWVSWAGKVFVLKLEITLGCMSKIREHSGHCVGENFMWICLISRMLVLDQHMLPLRKRSLCVCVNK